MSESKTRDSHPFILIVEATLGGHRMAYLKHLIHALNCERGIGVILATLPESLRSAAIEAVVGPEHQHRVFYPLPPNAWTAQGAAVLPRQFALFRASSARLRAARAVHAELSKQYNIVAVFLPCLDEFWPHIALQSSPFPNARWTGITMRRRFHFLHMNILWPLSILDRLDQLVFQRWMHMSSNSALGAFDRYLVDYVHQYHGGVDRVYFVPDPIEEFSHFSREHARRCLDIEDQLVLLLYGHLDDRKGLKLLAQALSTGLFPTSVLLLVVGYGASQAAALFRRACPSVEIRCIDKFLSSEEQNLAFAAADVVWVAYDGHAGPSGVLAQAGKRGLPVLSRRQGVIGRQVADGQLGWHVDTPAEVCGVLTAVSQNRATLAERRPLIAGQFEAFTVSNFVDAVVRYLV